MSLLFLGSFILLLLGLVLIYKSEEKQSIVENTIIGFITELCIGGMIAQCLSILHLKISLLSVGSGYLVFALLVWIYIIYSKRVQKLYLSLWNVYAIIFIAMWFGYVFAKTFSFDLNNIYRNSDPGYHYWKAMQVVNTGKVTSSMFFSEVYNALVIELLMPFLSRINYYKAFILADTWSTILNILLDLFCILILDWGVAGAAVATVFSQGVSAVLCYLYMMRHFEILKGTPTEHKFRGALAKTLLYIGVPMGLQFSITAIGSIMLQSANNALGTACVAAFTAAMRIKMFCMCPLESLGIAMATYSGQNYGAGKPKRIWLGIKASVLMMVIYCGFMFVVLMLGARTFALLFVDPAEWEILKDTELFLHISVSFFPVLGLLCILRYSIQGVGFTNLAMLSGVSEMIARIMVSLYAVPILRYLAVCFGDPTAWIFAVIFLIPAFIYVYGRIKRMSTSGMVKY